MDIHGKLGNGRTICEKALQEVERSCKIITYELKNYTEIIVHQALQDYLRNNKIACSCERCLADIMSLTLNRLPARYYVSKQGELIIKSGSLDLSDQVRVMADVVHSVQQVSTKPSHSLL